MYLQIPLPLLLQRPMVDLRVNAAATATCAPSSGLCCARSIAFRTLTCGRAGATFMRASIHPHVHVWPCACAPQHAAHPTVPSAQWAQAGDVVWTTTGTPSGFVIEDFLPRFLACTMRARHGLVRACVLPRKSMPWWASAAYTHSVPLAPTSSRARLLPRPSCSDESDLFGCTACQQTQNEDTAEHEGNRAHLAPRTPAGLPLQVSSLPSAIAHSPVRVREGETVTRA